jgi:hypothetical protein
MPVIFAGRTQGAQTVSGPTVRLGGHDPAKLVGRG